MQRSNAPVFPACPMMLKWIVRRAAKTWHKLSAHSRNHAAPGYDDATGSATAEPKGKMTKKLPLYGYLGFTHGWAQVLTVMSPSGTQAVWQNVTADDDVIVYGYGDPTTLPQFHEKRAGALQRLIDRYGIKVVEKPEWDALKAEMRDD